MPRGYALRSNGVNFTSSPSSGLPLNEGVRAMKDMQAHLEKLRIQVAECEMIRDLATDPKKRELFGRLAEHHRTLAAEIERAIAARETRPGSA
jgi:hypothetical protein